MICKREYHGRSHIDDKTYETWKAMRERCANPNNCNYKYYGGKGVKVCERWDSFLSFLQDMGERPKKMTIDRLDSNKNYEPQNCRWASQATQNRSDS